MKTLRSLFGLFVISSLVSQSAMDLFSTFLCGWWIYLLFFGELKGKRHFLFSKTGVEPFFIGWFLVSVLGFLFHWNDTSYALSRIIEFKWILIFYIFVGVLKVLKPDSSTKNFIFYLAAVVATVNLLLYFLNIPVLNPWRYGAEGDYVRAGGFFANPMTFGHSYVIFISFLLGIFSYVFKTSEKNFKIFSLFVLLASYLGLFLTFTRGVWIGFCSGLGLALLIWRPKVLVGLIVIAGILLPAAYYGSDLFRNRIDQTRGEVSGFSERKLIWQANWHIFKTSPFIGVGYGQNSKMLPQVYAELGIPDSTLVSHAHNQYLHLAAGTGILGLLCYLGIWFVFLSKSFGLWFKAKLDSWDRGVVWGLIVGQVAFLVGGLTESNFEHSKVRFMVMLAWAYVIYLSDKYKRDRHS